MACCTWLRAPICPEPEIPPPVNLVCKKKPETSQTNKKLLRSFSSQERKAQIKYKKIKHLIANEIILQSWFLTYPQMVSCNNLLHEFLVCVCIFLFPLQQCVIKPKCLVIEFKYCSSILSKKKTRKDVIFIPLLFLSPQKSKLPISYVIASQILRDKMHL